MKSNFEFQIAELEFALERLSLVSSPGLRSRARESAPGLGDFVGSREAPEAAPSAPDLLPEPGPRRLEIY